MGMETGVRGKPRGMASSVLQAELASDPWGLPSEG